MKNADKPIYPAVAEIINETEFTEYNLPHRQMQLSGLSKREYFAGLAMQGLIAGRWACPDNVPNDVETITREALLHADEILKQLENTK
ncbi:hypothetical protein CMU45_02765 [Elizabethkingia anophelis]|nr:hypothetical protein [Elizabethkingia anophelis]